MVLHVTAHSQNSLQLKILYIAIASDKIGL